MVQGKNHHDTIQLRRGHSDLWTLNDPILADGEPGYESDTKKHKIGDGISQWTELGYALADIKDPEDDTAALAALQEHIDSPAPHPVYDDGPSFLLLYQNAKV